MAETKRKRIAAVVTTYFTNSHADVIVGKFLRGFPTDDGLLAPEVDVVSIFMDQLSPVDVGVALARRHGVRICSSIQEALCLDEGTLAVDGVLSIGEHGICEWRWSLDSVSVVLPVALTVTPCRLSPPGGHWFRRCFKRVRAARYPHIHHAP